MLSVPQDRAERTRNPPKENYRVVKIVFLRFTFLWSNIVWLLFSQSFWSLIIHINRDRVYIQFWYVCYSNNLHLVLQDFDACSRGYLRSGRKMRRILHLLTRTWLFLVVEDLPEWKIKYICIYTWNNKMERQDLTKIRCLGLGCWQDIKLVLMMDILDKWIIWLEIFYGFCK